MAMKKNISKALAMAVMMSVLAGGSAYAQTFTETVVIDGDKPIILNPNGSATGTKSIEIVGPNNYITAMGSDRFEITRNGEVYVGLYAGGLSAYGATVEGRFGYGGLQIANLNSSTPFMAFTMYNVDVGNNVIRNVGVGDISSAASTDAVNGGQIYTMTNVAKGNYIAAGTDVAGNLTALDTQVKINADDIATLKTDKADKTYVDTELAKKANVADVYTKSETESAISTAVNTATAGKADKSYVDTELGKKADKATTLAGYGITDAYTKTETDTELAKKADKAALDTEVQERKDADADLQKQIDAIGGGSSAGLNELNNKINQTNDRVDRVGATAAALAGINYQPMAKGQSQVAIGMGGYKGKKATAIGMAYQISDRISGSVAGAANGSEHMFNVGFNYLFGQHSDKDVAQMAAVPGSVSLKEAEMQATIDSQGAKINTLEAEIAELKAMVKALAAK